MSDDSLEKSKTRSQKEFVSVIVKSGKDLNREGSKLLYYLVAIGLLNIAFIMPLILLSNRSYAWFAILPGLLVILLAYNLYRPNKSLFQDVSHDSESNISASWAYRPQAREEISSAIRSSKDNLFISGLALTTVTDILNDPKVCAALVESYKSNANYKFKILLLRNSKHPRSKELGGKELKEKLTSSQKRLSEFKDKLEAAVPAGVARPLVEVLTYSSDITPRHFILQTDDVIYAGSYLNHKPGSFSYLIKIISTSNDLYALFNKEIEYLLNIAQPILLNSNKTV